MTLSLELIIHALTQPPRVECHSLKLFSMIFPRHSLGLERDLCHSHLERFIGLFLPVMA